MAGTAPKCEVCGVYVRASFPDKHLSWSWVRPLPGFGESVAIMALLFLFYETEHVEGGDEAN